MIDSGEGIDGDGRDEPLGHSPLIGDGRYEPLGHSPPTNLPLHPNQSIKPNYSLHSNTALPDLTPHRHHHQCHQYLHNQSQLPRIPYEPYFTPSRAHQCPQIRVSNDVQNLTHHQHRLHHLLPLSTNLPPLVRVPNKPFVLPPHSRLSSALDQQNEHAPDLPPSPEDESSDEVNGLSEVIISIHLKKKKLSAASFSYTTYEIEIFETVEIFNENYSIVDTLIMDKLPILIIICSCGSAKFYEHIEDLLKTFVRRNSNIIRKLAPCHFEFDTCRERVLQMNIVNNNGEMTAEDRINYVLSVINVTDEILVCALGALIHYINFASYELNMHTTNALAARIYAIKPMVLKNILGIDVETYRSLQIFDPVHHPSSFKWVGTRTKEGLSLFSLFEQHSAPVAFRKLRAFMSKPVNDIELIKRRHEVINFCVNPRNKSVLQDLKAMLTQLTPGSTLSKYLDWPTERAKHWLSVYRNIHYGLLFAETCRNYPDIQMFQQVANKITQEMYSMVHHLANILDFENMNKFDMFFVREGFYAPLEKAKERYSKVSAIINKVTPYEFDTVPDFIKKINLIYVPEMGFMLVIPFWAHDLTIDDLFLPYLQFKFCSNRVAYYKSSRCLMLDETYGDPIADIIGEECKIILALRKYLHKHINNVIDLIENIIDLDCVFALGLQARYQNYVMPDVIEENMIQITNGRHPILSMYQECYVPNDTLLAPLTGHNMKVIYGPIASGKTVYLKQVAIIAYMVHIGSFVPADHVRIGLLSHIHGRIQTYESIMSSSSSLLTEFRRIGAVIANNTCRSLIVLDEVGRCTSEIDNVAMLASVVNHFLTKGNNCPFVLISTRLYGLDVCLQQHYKIPYYVMDFKFDDDKIVYGYKLKREKNISNFTFCALDAVCKDKEMVEAAKQVYDTLHKGENKLPYCQLRLKKTDRYMRFLIKFATKDVTDEDNICDIQNMIQRYFYNCI